jgi:hypothetical protein
MWAGQWSTSEKSSDRPLELCVAGSRTPAEPAPAGERAVAMMQVVDQISPLARRARWHFSRRLD